MERRPSIWIHVLQRIGNLFFTINLSCNNNLRKALFLHLFGSSLEKFCESLVPFRSCLQGTELSHFVGLRRPGLGSSSNTFKDELIDPLLERNKLTKIGTYSQNILWNNFLSPLLSFHFYFCKLQPSNNNKKATTKITFFGSRMPFTSILLEPFVYSMGGREGVGVLFHTG